MQKNETTKQHVCVCDDVRVHVCAHKHEKAK